MLKIKIGHRRAGSSSILAARTRETLVLADGQGCSGRGASLAFPWLAVLSVFLLAGCQKEDLRAYRIPKEPEKPASTPSQTAEAASSDIVCNPPAGWTQMTPGPMQQALFAAKGSDSQQAQVSVVMLAGPAGGELDNVNRWRGQAKLGPIQPEELKSLTEEVEIAGITGHLFDLGGTATDNPGALRIIAAILQRDGNSWFFKMMGDDALVKAQKNTFKDFLKNTRFRQAGNASPAQAAAASSVETNAAPAAPTGWQTTTPGPMQTAKYVIPGEGGVSGEVTISELGGEGGGLLANVNRWRRQLELGAIEPAGLAGLTNGFQVGSSLATMVDLVNEDKKSRLLVVVLPTGNKTIFYKLNGPQSLVGREKDTFLRFVQSAR
jgi:hypothetical protein